MGIMDEIRGRIGHKSESAAAQAAKYELDTNRMKSQTKFENERAKLARAEVNRLRAEKDKRRYAPPSFFGNILGGLAESSRPGGKQRMKTYNAMTGQWE